MTWLQRLLGIGGLKLDYTFDPKDIIEARRTPQGIKIFMDGKELTREALADLKQEAVKLSKSPLRGIIQTKLKALALDKAVNTSTKWEEVLAGKMILYTLQIEETIVTALLEVELQ